MNTLRNLFTNHLVAKIVSVALAITLWSTIKKIGTTTSRSKIQVDTESKFQFQGPYANPSKK